jgi:hypothetical protein
VQKVSRSVSIAKYDWFCGFHAKHRILLVVCSLLHATVFNLDEEETKMIPVDGPITVATRKQEEIVIRYRMSDGSLAGSLQYKYA